MDSATIISILTNPWKVSARSNPDQPEVVWIDDGRNDVAMVYNRGIAEYVVILHNEGLDK